MRMLKALLFDVGDTLIEYIKNDPLEGTKALLKIAHNPNQVTAEAIQSYALEMGRVFEEARESTSIEYRMQSFQRFLYEMHGISFDLTPLQVENIFNQHAFIGEAMEGILPFLDALEEAGIRKAILSNSSFSEAAIREELRRYGIDDKRFEFVMVTSEYGFRKPHKKIFELALSKFKLNAHEIGYIGNSFKYDVQGAQNAAIFPIWFNKQGNKGDYQRGEVLEVTTYKEVASWLTLNESENT